MRFPLLSYLSRESGILPSSFPTFFSSFSSVELLNQYLLSIMSHLHFTVDVGLWGLGKEMEPKQKQHPVVDMTGDGSKVQCCKEQYCMGTWNVRFMNQGKLEVLKQEMARVSIVVLGISELKWTGMGEFNSDDHYIYYCGQESYRRNGVVTVNKRV